MGTGVSCQSVEVHPSTSSSRLPFASKVTPASISSLTSSSKDPKYSKKPSTKKRASKVSSLTSSMQLLDPKDYKRDHPSEKKKRDQSNRKTLDGNELSSEYNDDFCSSRSSSFETSPLSVRRQTQEKITDEEKTNCSWCQKQWKERLDKSVNDDDSHSIHHSDDQYDHMSLERDNEVDERSIKKETRDNMIEEEREETLKGESQETTVSVILEEQETNDEDNGLPVKDDDEDRGLTVMTASEKSRLSMSMMMLHEIDSDKEEGDDQERTREEDLSRPDVQETSRLLNRNIPSVNLERAASENPDDQEDFQGQNIQETEEQLEDQIEVNSTQATCNSSAGDRGCRGHGSLFDTFECNSMPTSTSSSSSDNDDVAIIPPEDDVSVDETSLAVNLRSESICTSCKSGSYDDDDDIDDLDADVLRAVRRTDMIDDTEDGSVRDDSDCYRVIEELELSKYEVEQPASAIIQMQQQQLAQYMNQRGRVDPSKTCSKPPLLSRKSTKSLIPTLTVAGELAEGDSNSIGFDDPALLGIITQEGKKHTRNECNNPDCGLCFLMDSSLEGNDWDQLDTETVTLMDVLERLSKILAEKAKSLINKKAVKTASPKRPHVHSRGTPGKEGDEVVRYPSPSTVIQKRKRQFRKEPLKGLKASGVAVKKVEHRRRVIVVKDGSSQYYIQGKLFDISCF